MRRFAASSCSQSGAHDDDRASRDRKPDDKETAMIWFVYIWEASPGSSA